MTRIVHLPAVNKTVTLAAYVKAVQLAMKHPDREFQHGFTTWWPTKGRDIVRQFRDGMIDRINHGVPYSKRGIQQ